MSVDDFDWEENARLAYDNPIEKMEIVKHEPEVIKVETERVVEDTDEKIRAMRLDALRKRVDHGLDNHLAHIQAHEQFMAQQAQMDRVSGNFDIGRGLGGALGGLGAFQPGGVFRVRDINEINTIAGILNSKKVFYD